MLAALTAKCYVVPQVVVLTQLRYGITYFYIPPPKEHVHGNMQALDISCDMHTQQVPCFVSINSAPVTPLVVIG